MMTKQRCSHGGYIWIFAFTAALLIFNNCLSAAEQTPVLKEPGFKKVKVLPADLKKTPLDFGEKNFDLVLMELCLARIDD